MFRPLDSLSGWLCACVLLCSGVDATWAEGQSAAQRPLAVRNLSPVGQLYGLPTMLGTRPCCESLEVSFRIAQVSNFTAANQDGVQLFFDGETTVAEYQLRSNWGQRVHWGVAVPLVQHGGGFLDRSIDGFHQLFDLPDGGRDRARRNQLDYLIRVDGENFAAFRDNRKGFGDVRAWLSYPVDLGPSRNLTLRTQVKLPTGRVDRLTGSQALDLALWAELEERAALSALGVVLSLGAGAVWLGQGELAPQVQESHALVGHFGLRRRFGRNLTLLAQLDAHSALYEGGPRALGGSALMGSLGLRARVTPRFALELGIIEDLRTRSAADVAFQLQLDARL